MKDKKASKEGGAPLIPLQIKLREETREQLKAIAKNNGLSLNDIGTMAIAAGLGVVETKLREMREPDKQAA